MIRLIGASTRIPAGGRQPLWLRIPPQGDAALVALGFSTEAPELVGIAAAYVLNAVGDVFPEGLTGAVVLPLSHVTVGALRWLALLPSTHARVPLMPHVPLGRDVYLRLDVFNEDASGAHRISVIAEVRE